MSLPLEFASAVDMGRLRSNNEDTVKIGPELGLAVLADGMGGYSAGEVASELAAAQLVEELGGWLTREQGPQPPPDADVRSALLRGAQAANHAVFEAARARPECAGMGTTLVAALFVGERVWIGNVGDSRAYRWRAGQLQQLSRDHSLLQEQLDAGVLSPEEAVWSIHRNLVTRAIGPEPQVEFDVDAHDVNPADVILMCSDGLSDMLNDVQIAHIMRSHDGGLDALAKALVDAANEAGGRDNISVVLVRVGGQSARPGRSWWPFKGHKA